MAGLLLRCPSPGGTTADQLDMPTCCPGDGSESEDQANKIKVQQKNMGVATGRRSPTPSPTPSHSFGRRTYLFQQGLGFVQGLHCLRTEGCALCNIKMVDNCDG